MVSIHELVKLNILENELFISITRYKLQISLEKNVSIDLGKLKKSYT